MLGNFRTDDNTKAEVERRNSNTKGPKQNHQNKRVAKLSNRTLLDRHVFVFVF